MNPLEDVTPLFGVERVYDAVAAHEWIVAAAGAAGLSCVRTGDGAALRIASGTPLDAPILVAGNTLFFRRNRAALDPGGKTLRIEPFVRDQGPGLEAAAIPHHSFAGRRHLFLRSGQGDLVRIRLEDGRAEIPTSPYGRYGKDALRTFGVGPARRSAVIQARHPSRNETVVDVLPEDPDRPVARAAVLKDGEWGTRLFGPAVAGRRAVILAPEKGCLLLLHLHNPEAMETLPAPPDFSGEPEVLLAASAEGTVAAASRRGLHLLHGPGAPRFAPFPGEGPHTPLRLLLGEGFALVVTGEGRLYGLRGP